MDVLAHLHDRHVDPSRYSLGWDDETATFLVFDLSGRVTGYQRYRPFAPKLLKNDEGFGRYYTYFTGTSKHDRQPSVWGLETLHYRNDVLFVTEGVFDSVRLHNLGLPSVATMSNDPRNVGRLLYLLGQSRRLVAVCDADQAGMKLAKFGHESLVCSGGKDLGDMTDEEVRRTVRKRLTLS